VKATDEDRPSCWVDLLDPDDATLQEAVGLPMHDTAWSRLRRPAMAPDKPSRPRLVTNDTYVWGVLTIPYQSGEELLFREVDVVVTPDRFVTIRKTPKGAQPFPCEHIKGQAEHRGASPGLCLYLLIDDVAEQFLDLIDGFDEDINALEDNIDDWPSTEVRTAISGLRHDLLHVRRSLAPTRDLARSVLDDRVELEDAELFPRDVELRFADAYDKLLRATDGLDLSRDLLAGVRDYHQAQVSIEQNEVMKRLTVVASMLLLPTFIVGMYGQNLRGIPEFHFRYGYAFSWALIIITTIGQYVYFKRKGWIGEAPPAAARPPADNATGAAPADR